MWRIVVPAVGVLLLACGPAIISARTVCVDDSTPETSKNYAAEPICETTIPGDINGDRRVDFTDLALLAKDGGMIPRIARCYAALCLGVSGDSRAFEPLVQQLRAGTFLEQKCKITSSHKDDYHISRYAALALGYLGDRRAVEPLIQTLRAKAYFECAFALGRLADLRARWPIIDYLSENLGSGSVAHEVLTYLTMAQFTIASSGKDRLNACNGGRITRLSG